VAVHRLTAVHPVGSFCLGSRIDTLIFASCLQSQTYLRSRFYSSFVDDNSIVNVRLVRRFHSIAGRTETLRREVELIQQEERSYRSHKAHSLAEREEHDRREFRILAIREELRTLVEKAKEQLSHGSVWYS
jgi:hypothetical protein